MSTKKTGLILKVEETGLESTRAKEMEAVFIPMVKKFTELEDGFNAIMKVKEVDPKLVAQARALRLVYQKIRTGTDALHKAKKANLLIETRALDGLRNIVKYAVTENEDKLMAIEKHYENLEIKRKAELKESRELKLEAYGGTPEGIIVEDMADDVWKNYLVGVQAAHQIKIEAEKKAEADRKAEEERIRKAQELDKLRVQRGHELSNIGVPWNEDQQYYGLDDSFAISVHDVDEKTEAEFNEVIETFTKEIEKRKAKTDAEAAKVEAERKAKEAKDEKIRKEAEARAEQAEKLRLKAEADLKAKQDADKKAADQKAEAERQAGLAPDKEKLEALIVTIDAIEMPKLATKEAAEIIKNVKGLVDKVTGYIERKSKEL